MSEPTSQPVPPANAKEAKAAAKAAKAYAKNMRPWYKKKRFIIPAALIALVVAISAFSGGGTDDPVPPASSDGEAEATPPSSGDGEAEATAAIGTPVRDGKFEFVVNGVECGATQIGNEFVNTQAQGQFCILELTVMNIGDEAQYFSGENVTLYNAEGQEYSADTEAAFYLEESDTIFEEINPGNTLSGKVVFDIPGGVTPVEAELHDSLFSGGVKVSLV